MWKKNCPIGLKPIKKTNRVNDKKKWYKLYELDVIGIGMGFGSAMNTTTSGSSLSMFVWCVCGVWWCVSTEDKSKTKKTKTKKKRTVCWSFLVASQPNGTVHHSRQLLTSIHNYRQLLSSIKMNWGFIFKNANVFCCSVKFENSLSKLTKTEI